MRLIPLPIETRALTGCSHKAIVNYLDLNTTAATTKTIQLLADLVPADNLGAAVASNFTIPAGSEIRDCGWMLLTPFTGGVISAMTLDLGIGGTASKFIAAASTDLFTALSSNTKGCGRNTTAYTFTQADVITGTVCAVTALFTATGANLNALTAGLMEIYFTLNRMPDIQTVGQPGQ
jgi:hypothetical protein